jgi:hypothetical protein
VAGGILWLIHAKSQRPVHPGTWTTTTTMTRGTTQ